MAGLPDDPDEAVPQELSDEDAVEYERRVLAELRRVMIGGEGGLVEVDAVDSLGSRPDTLVVFRYHYRPLYLGRHPSTVAGPRAEVARLWEFAIDAHDPWSPGLMDPPNVLAAAIGSSFDASELHLVDPDTLAPMGSAPNIFPRRYDLTRPLPG